jgi:Uma2 family endonuclease
MPTIITDEREVTIPNWVDSLDAFRRWTDDADFPQTGKTWWLRGQVWVDMSKEQIFWHLLVKTEFTFVLAGLVKAGKLGLYLTDGLLLSNFAADISGNPDGTFISTATLQSDRVRLIEGKRGGFTELQGSPDMVLEILSDSSEQKDKDILRRGYWEADVPEYWLVDARTQPLQFDVLRHTARGYVAARKQQGWVKSAVFGKAFRLRQFTNALGHPEYTLEVR